MPYPIQDKLVVAVATTALFDLSEESEIFFTQGLQAFRDHQIKFRHKIPEAGSAFPFVKRFLGLNTLFPELRPVEVVLLSRNHPDAGLRIMDAIKHYGLDITRASFLAGRSPYPFMQSVGAVLFLSTDKTEVTEAVTNGYPAGLVLPYKAATEDDDNRLCVAFDFDGVLADDEAESINQQGGLPLFHAHEEANRHIPLNPGPLMPLLQGLSRLQKLKPSGSNSIEKAVEVAIVTARNAPANERIITTLKKFDIETDQLFLTGGIEKKRYLDVLRPHMFFVDQLGHLTKASELTPCVHIPFGVLNRVEQKQPEEARVC